MCADERSDLICAMCRPMAVVVGIPRNCLAKHANDKTDERTYVQGSRRNVLFVHPFGKEGVLISFLPYPFRNLPT